MGFPMEQMKGKFPVPHWFTFPNPATDHPVAFELVLSRTAFVAPPY